MADPWVITAIERSKHEEQFKSLPPSGGYITGEQAKGFFLQSRLPPQVLGVIWMLADMDGDGRMNLTEFSIACKLINMKLRGSNIPQTLPMSIKQSAAGVTAPAAVFPTAMPVASPLMPDMTPMMPSNVAINPSMPLATQQPMTAQAGFHPHPAPAAQPVDPTPVRTASQDSGTGTPVDGIPQPTKLKFTQLFNISDRTKCGFISGVQARNILIQSQLPQPALAQIWALSDIDNDGRLSCDEFVLAMYLCEQAKAGVKVPVTLPVELIPVALRRSRTSSIQSTGSVTTPVEGTLLAGLINDTSFEDRRRENYEKGQAELDRRRKVILDAQRREAEERLRKEREEEAKREKARQEAERRKQEELEKEMQHQREMEAQMETERKRQEEFKEHAKKEAERQRQQEWEKQRLQELTNVRQKQQENLLAMKAKNQSLGIDLASKDDKVKELTQKISTTRVGVTEVKATIDSMRTTRDTHMADMSSLKGQAREQNQRLLNLNQEKARLKARSLATAGASGAETAVVEASVTSKQMVIKHLQEKLEELKQELDNKKQDANNNETEFGSLKEQLVMTAERCKDLFSEFTTKKTEVLALREKLVNPDAAWGDSGSSAWAGNQSTWAEACPPCPMPASVSSVETEKQQPPSRPPPPEAASVGFASAPFPIDNKDTSDCFSPDPEPVKLPAQLPAQTEPADVVQYRAVYEFEARNEDELTFNPGDIILVTPSTGAEPGWLSGQLNGKSGWFPIDYCELFSEVAPVVEVLPTATAVVAPVTSPEAIESSRAVALFTWEATQNNHLSLQKRDQIDIHETWGDWAYGTVNDMSGWFPFCFVRMVHSFDDFVSTPTEQPVLPPMPDELQHNDLSQYYSSSFPYKSNEPGDLEFETAEQVLVVKKDGDWWFGVIGLRRGIFPSNYVQLVQQPLVENVPSQVLEREPSPVQQMPLDMPMSQEQPDEPENKGRKPDVAQVLAPYDATGPNQLSLVRGQLVMIRKKTSSGWWEGELQAKGKRRQLGWFPATYVKVLCGSSRSTPVSFEMSNRDELPSEQTLEILLKNAKNYKPATPEPIETSTTPQGEQVEAVYPYAASNPDELTFEPGDIISVVDKEDSAWWKGSLNGNVGVFPSNYVQPLQSPSQDDSLCSAFYAHFNTQEESKRQQIIHEIITTEQTYLKDLILVQQAFIQPMRSSGIITQRELDLIFVNWDDLIQVCSTFNKSLRVRTKNSERGSIHLLSDILFQQLALMTPYVRFCSLQMKGGALLDEKCSEGGMWSEVVKKCQESSRVGGHTLTSFLLKPIQRITRYPLLIKKLLSATPTSHPDYHNTIEAMSSAETLCEQVNEAMQQKDNTDKLEWMQSHVKCDDLPERLLFNSLTNILGPRKVVLMGTLTKTKSKKELVIFLMSDFILLSTPSKPIGNCTSLAAFERSLAQTNCTMYRRPMFLNEVTVTAVADSEVSFVLSCPNTIDLTISSHTSHQRNNWLKKIALAKKHIEDTEKSLFTRRQSQEKKAQFIGRVLVEVTNGAELRSKNSGTLNSFCEVSLGSQSQQTSVGTGSNPKWNATQQFLVKSLQEDVLCVTVYEKGYFRPNAFLGRTEIRVQKINEESSRARGPVVTKLKLEEVEHGDITIKTSFHPFKTLSF